MSSRRVNQWASPPRLGRAYRLTTLNVPACVQVGKKRREDIGVELYNFQQQLAKLQMALERTHDEFSNLNRSRLEARFKLTLPPLLDERAVSSYVQSLRG